MWHCAVARGPADMSAANCKCSTYGLRADNDHARRADRADGGHPGSGADGNTGDEGHCGGLHD